VVHLERDLLNRLLDLPLALVLTEGVEALDPVERRLLGEIDHRKCR